MSLIFSKAIIAKLQDKHGVNKDEVAECFLNRDGGLLIDTREEHHSDPPTKWFVAETDMGRVLKVCFIQHSDGKIIIKTAYEPNKSVIAIYDKYAR